MIINLYIFDKRENSTKQPSGSGWEQDGQLRSSCSVLQPQVAFKFHSSPADYNYAYIPDFLRYYYVSWTFDQGLWWANMQVDALASWRQYIGDRTEYVLRSSALSDGSIMDTTYPTQTAPIIKKQVDTSLPWDNDAAQSYVLGVVGKGGPGITYYSFSPANFQQLAAALLSDTDYVGSDLGTVTSEGLKAQFNPFQYLTTCYAYPWKNDGDDTSEMQLGWWTVNAHSRKNSSNRLWFLTFGVPAHPDSSRGSYLNHAPYTRHELYFPCFGTIPIDPDKITGGSLSCYVNVDQRTGAGVLEISSGSTIIDIVRGQVGVPTMLAQTSSNYIAAAGGIVNTVKSVITQDWLGAAAGIGDAISAAAPQVRTSGSAGSFVEFDHRPTFTSTFYRPVPEDNEHKGRPLCKPVQLRTIPGYIQVEAADLSIPATAAENTAIKNYMEGGFYYE